MLILFLIPLLLGLAFVFAPGTDDGGDETDHTGTQGNDFVDDSQRDAGEVYDMLGGDDTVFAGAGNDTIRGGAGDDTLYGEGGDDRLEGDAGDDTLYPGAGSDVVHGGGGNDSLLADAINGGSGAERLFGGDGNDLIAAGDGDDWLDGGRGDDALIGGPGHDILTGGEGNDVFALANDAGGPDDVRDFDPAEDQLRIIVGPVTGNGPGTIEVNDWADGRGADILYEGNLLARVAGAQGLDPLEVDLIQQDIYPPTTSYFASTGDDHIRIYSPDASVTVNGLAGSDTILNVSGGPAIIGGDGGNDTLVGGAGADQIFGGSGNDLIDGDGGDDTLVGGPGNDTLHSGTGTDTLSGGSGNDFLLGEAGGLSTLTGGEGNDTFARFLRGSDASGADTYSIITDFTPADDRIELAIPFGDSLDIASARADITVTNWADGTGADVFYQGVLQARVSGGQGLTATDIAIVQPTL